MHRSVLGAVLAALVVLVACAGGDPTPSVAPVATPSLAPSASTTLAPTPATPPTGRPSVEPTPGSSPAPEPTSLVPNAAEQALIDGILRGVRDCRPARDQLPEGAIAGIECASGEPAVARIGFYRFADDRSMLDAYLARMAAEGIELDSGSCVDGESEGAYIPEEGFAAQRQGCFINDAGFANYRVTLPGPSVYIGILGRTDDMRALEDFAWRGNMDTPGTPTLWTE